MGGASSPLPEPPTLSGTLGAPSAQPSGPVRDAGDLGKIESFARAEPIATRHVISALLFARGREPFPSLVTDFRRRPPSRVTLMA